MNILRYSFFILALGICFVSCRKDLVDESELVGTWQCIDILKDTPATRSPSDIKFTFKADSTYTYSLANEYSEDGTFYTLDDKLYTTPNGGSKMMVKLGVSGSDTLRFHQNRGGRMEVWTMLRK